MWNVCSRGRERCLSSLLTGFSLTWCDFQKGLEKIVIERKKESICSAPDWSVCGRIAWQVHWFARGNRFDCYKKDCISTSIFYWQTFFLRSPIVWHSFCFLSRKPPFWLSIIRTLNSKITCGVDVLIGTATKIIFIFWLHSWVQQSFCGWGNHSWNYMKWLCLPDKILKCVSRLRWLISLKVSMILVSVCQLASNRHNPHVKSKGLGK